MIDNPSCPVCGGDNWTELAEKRYSMSRPAPDAYQKVRQDVFFKLWFPGRKEVSLKSVLCDSCGFVCYAPRPEATDIHSKYAYLAEHELASKEFSVRRTSDIKRSKELYRALKPFLGGKRNTILDYGGGNGRLLQSLLAAGQDCYIVELVDEVLPGITYIGNNISDAIERGNFDFVVCSHVLEHLVDPVETVINLSKALREDGLMYIEVPNELWRRPPPKIDPVTHINFFSPDSMRTLLETAGLEIISCDYRPFTRPNGLVGMAVKAVAKRTPSANNGRVSLRGPGLALSQLTAGPASSLLRIARHPSLLANLYRKPAA